MRIKHAYTGLVYETTEDGNVTVTDPESGKSGLFTPDREWISGDIKTGDWHLIGHVGGKTAQGASSLGTFGRRRR
tara:strand:+ start:345 stop:569 length:225 start_codon:yes stop_codon:yes gene_type:complete